MGSNFFNCRPVIRFIRKKFQDKVLEVFAKALTVNFGPICFNPLVNQQFVEIFFFSSLFEWEDTLHNDEKNDT